MSTATLLTNLSVKFPNELEIIGRLLMTYGELEFSMAVCIGEAIADPDQAIRVIYRTYGEERRIAVAGALGLPRMAKLGLGHRFMAALSDMQCCRQIRNQYAHGHFMPSGDGTAPLRVMDIQESAESNTPLMLTMRPLQLDTLQQQDRFFTYVANCLDLLRDGAKGTTPIPRLQWPIQMLKPPQYTGQQKRAPQTPPAAPEPSPQASPPESQKSQNE